MATVTAPLDELLSLLSPSARAALRAEFESNAAAKTMVDEGLTFRKAYLEGDDEAPPAKVETAKTEKVETPAKVETTAGADLAALTKTLGELNTRLIAQDERLKKVVTKDELPALEGVLLGKAIRNAHMVAKLEMTHKSEFGEELDLTKLNEYLEEQKKSGRQFADISSVYEDMMREKRTQKKIADGIAEGIKQKKSGESVPGQSSSSGSTSAAQELIRKQRGESGSGDHMTQMADRLRKVREAREAAQGGAGEEAA